MAPAKDQGKAAAALKRKSDEPQKMEDSVILQPMMNDSLVALGDLWDCRSSTCPGNIFGSPFTKEHLEAHPIQYTEYKIHHSKNTGDRANVLDVSASLKLDFVFGGGDGTEGAKKESLTVDGSVTFSLKDTKKFDQDELLCTYDTSTYCVRVKPAAKNIIDPIMKEKLVKGTVVATHFVQSVRLGGQATASIRYNEMVESTNMNITGKLDVTLVVGPVNVHGEAELTMLDDRNENKYSTDVNVKARPRLDVVTTVADMFKEIRSIEDKVKAETHFEEIFGTDVCGVPLTFKLVPIHHLIDYESEAFYHMLAEDMMNNFTSMVFTCQDFMQPDYIKGLIREKDARLVTILKDESNPFTKKISKVELKRAIMAKDIKSKAFRAFALYKDSKGDTKPLEELLSYYEENFKIIKLMAKIQLFVEEGKKELVGIHASDVVDLGGEVKFFSNAIDLADWWQAERKIKILLKTSHKTASPSGTFLRLFDLSGPLNDLGVEIGIAFPNISEDFSMTFKVRDKEVVYHKEEIVFALEVLGVAVESGDMMSNLFYTLNGVLSGLNMTSVAENLPDINSLVRIFRESRGVAICETYPQLLATLTESMPTQWNFVVPLQGILSSVEMMKFFRQLRESLPLEHRNLNFRWIIGKFNLKDEFDAPLLFVFRDNELRAICLDHLDILILLNQLKISATNPDLSILSHKTLKKNCLYPARANFTIKVLEGVVLDHSTSLTDLVDYTVPGFKEVNDLSEAINVVRTCAVRNELDVLNMIATLSLADSSELEEILKKHRWGDAGFPNLVYEKGKWKELSKEIGELIPTKAPWLVQVDGAIRQLKTLNITKNPSPEEVIQVKAAIKSAVAFVTDFTSNGSTDDGPFTYMFKGTMVDEEEKYGELKGEIDSFKKSEVTVMLRGVLNALNRYFNEQLVKDEEEYKLFNIRQLRILVDFLASGMQTPKNSAESGESFKSILVDLAQKYTDRAIDSMKIPIDSFPGVSKNIEDGFAERNLFKVVGLLNTLQRDPLLWALELEFYNLYNLHNIEPTKRMIEAMGRGKYTPAQLTTVWLNPKFQYLIRQGLTNDALVETIFIELCVNPDPKKSEIPRFIPKDVAERLKPLFYSLDEPQFNFDKNWKNIHSAVQVFQILLTRKFIPSQFAGIFRQNIEVNQSLRVDFETCGALFYWNQEENLFEHPWGLHTTQRALALLMEANSPKKRSRRQLHVVPRAQSVPPPEPPKEVISRQDSTISRQNSAISRQSSTSSRKYSTLPRHDSTGSFTDNEFSFPVTDPWKRFTIGGYLDKVNGQVYLQLIRQLVPRPLVEYNDLNTTMNQIIPYLVQQARMHNSTSLQPTNTVSYIKYPPADGRPRPGFIDFEVNRKIAEHEKFLMSKADLATVLFNCVDPLVTHHILLSMMKTPMALPLIIPGISATANAGTFKLLLPALQNLIVQELEGVVPQPHLLTKPFRLICTIRVGETVGKVGRSTILNQLLMADHNLFSCFAEPGVENGKPVARTGIVEFTWLGKSTTQSDFYDAVMKDHYATNQPEMLLMANLHGDALGFQTMLDLLKTFTSSFVVFWKANNWNDLKAKKTELGKMIGAGSSVLDLVLYPDQTIIDHVGSQNLIGIGSEEEIAASRTKLHNVFREAIAYKSRAPLPTVRKVSTSGDATADTYADPGILNFIKQCTPTRTFIKYQLSDFDEDNISSRESHTLLAFIREMTVPRVKEAIMSGLPEAQEILKTMKELVSAILALPIEKRNSALTHFSYELDYLSRKSSESAVDRILKLRDELALVSGELDEREIAELQNDVKPVLNRLEASTLSTIDIFRYLINLEEDATIIDPYADYMNSGFPVEVFQPSYGDGTLWGDPLRAAMEATPQDTKIFVLSTIGLKAAGKSTLLNRLFGSAFQEGLAGCTQGLQMRFLWVEESLRKELKVDAICIVDSEGFGAPENLIDESADWRERNLASFLIGASHLVLANVLGESMDELKDILETSFTALTRVNEKGLTPDLFLVQQKLQNTASSNVVMSEWEEFLSSVKSVTRENELAIGVRIRETYRMETLRQRHKHSELLHTIRPLTPNEHLNSIEYHADIQRLYANILAACKASSKILTLGAWVSHTDALWNTLQESGSPNKYKSAGETKYTLSLSTSMDQVKGAVDTAFRYHDKIIDELFTIEVAEFFDLDPAEKLDPDVVPLLNRVHASLRAVINTCEIEEGGLPCKDCLYAFTSRETLFDETFGKKRSFLTVDAITDYMNEVRELLYGKYKQRVVALQIKHGKSNELLEILDEILEGTGDHWIKFKQHVSTLQTVIPAGHRIDEEVNLEYSSLPHILPSISDSKLPDLEKMVAFDVGHYNQAVESALVSPKRLMLNWEENDWLIAKMEDLPGVILTENGVQGYLVGMVRELKERMGQILLNFQDICGEQLQPNFKWEAHLYAIKVFKSVMVKKQAEWDLDNNPLQCLIAKKDKFPDEMFTPY